MDKEQYFKYEHVNCFRPGFFFMLKLMVFGKKIVEKAGPYIAVWYLYKDKIYLVKYQSIYI